MTMNNYGHTAKIYQFPVRGARGERSRITIGCGAGRRGWQSQRFADAADSGAWYHEVAIQEAERARKR